MTEAYQLNRAVRPSEQFCYATGDAGFNLLWVLYDSFLLYFLVRVAHLPAWSITPIVLCGRSADLIASIVFGLAGDRIRTRYGTYRPYLLILSLPMSATFVLLFTLPSRVRGAPGGLAFFWAVATAVIFAAFYSVGNAAYTALLSAMTSDNVARIRIASLRFAFAAVGVFAVQYLALPLSAYFGSVSEAHGWSVVAILCATGCASALIVVALGTRERVGPPAPLQLDLQYTMRDIARERGLVWLILAMISCLAALSSRAAASPFYLQTTLGLTSRIGFALALNPLAAFAACAAIPATIPRHWLKPLPLICTCAVTGVALCLMPALWGATSLWKILALQICFGAGTGLLLPTLFVLLSSTQHVGNLTPALMASVTLLALKTGSAAGALLASSCLAHAGVAGQADGRNLRGAASLFTLWPALLFCLSLLCLLAAARSRRATSMGEPVRPAF